MYLPQRLITLVLFACLSACVSVSLEKDKVRRSDSYRFKSPAEPFREHASPQVDKAWRSSKTGSIISIVSECSETVDPALPLVRDEVLRPITDIEVESEKQLSFQGRGALRSLAKGKVDGVESSVDILVFKKNGCTYILALVGSIADRRTDQPQFDGFLSGFEVP